MMPAQSDQRLYHICTLVTRWDQYASMKATFIAAGFDEKRCRYSTFDNSKGNQFEPYSLINELVSTTKEPYIILCHQDILLDQGCGYDELKNSLLDLESKDPRWGVLGNAGCTDDFDFVVRVKDPTPWQATDQVQKDVGLQPRPVHSLDENFLVLKTNAGLRASAQLSGFHLYGTDLCLNARRSGHTCYVIDFRLTHLSRGNFGEEFMAARERFVQHWQREFHFVYIIRGAEIFLSRWGLLRRLGPRHRVRQLFLRYRPLRKWMTRELNLRAAVSG